MWWKFFREQNGAIVPNYNEAAESISDAFVFLVRQDAGSPGMTVLARIEMAKGAFGRSKGRHIERSWQFTKPDAVALAVFSAQQVVPAYERFAANDDRVARAIAAATDGDGNTLEMAATSIGLAISDARTAGDEAAVFAAESARAAVVAALSADAGKALHAAAYSVLYSIQGAYKLGVGEDVTGRIEKWLYTWIDGHG
jgi:hypothetical protein